MPEHRGLAEKDLFPADERKISLYSAKKPISLDYDGMNC